MKGILLKMLAVVLMAGFGTGVYAQQKELISMTGYSYYHFTYDFESRSYIKVPWETPVASNYSQYYYNGNNELVMEKTPSATYRYKMNADGTAASRETATQRTVYEYDTNKVLVRATNYTLDANGTQTFSSAILYEDFENGECKVEKMVNGDGNVISETHYELTFNDNHQLITKVELTQNRQTEEFEVNSTSTYKYNDDGTISTRLVTSKSLYYADMEDEVEWQYVYSTLDAMYVPKNVKVDTSAGDNTATLTWDAVAGATGYVVIYDNLTADVEEGTQFTTPALSNGEHELAVLAIVDGERKNMSDFVIAKVEDRGNLPMLNFKVVSAEKIQVESWGMVREYYNLNVSWEVPALASPIRNYTLYVEPQKEGGYTSSARYTTNLEADQQKDDYNEDTSWSTYNSFYWSAFEDYEVDESYQLAPLGTGPVCKVWITALYNSGESAPSNVVEVNICELAKGASGIQAIQHDNNSDKSVEYFNLSGQRVNTHNGRQIVIMKQGNSVKKVLK